MVSYKIFKDPKRPGHYKVFRNGNLMAYASTITEARGWVNKGKKSDAEWFKLTKKRR